jgi:hypothetical protein
VNADGRLPGGERSCGEAGLHGNGGEDAHDLQHLVGRLNLNSKEKKMQENKRRTMNENNLQPHHSSVLSSRAKRGVARLARPILGALLMVAVITGVFALFASSRDVVRAGSVSPQLEGTWRVTVSITDGPPPFSGLASFNGGGTLQETDEIQLLSPSAGPQVGTWAKLGGNQYAFTWEAYLFDFATDSPGGRLKVSGVVTLTGSDTYTAVDEFAFYDTDGNVTFSGCATEEATRMTVESLTSCPGPGQTAIQSDGRSRPTKSWKN